jgi:hypothetical protein
MPGVLRFTIRDVLWLMVVAALVCMWWMEMGKSRRMSREREEAIAKWHYASQMWVEATRMRSQPPSSNGGGMGGGGMILGGASPTKSPAATDEDGESGVKEKSGK